VSAICPLVREGLGDYLTDRLPAPQRHILREHLAACETCRDAAASRDASLLFARPFSPEEVGADETAAILASVRTGVAHIETERRIGSARPARRRAAIAAAAAAAVLLLSRIPGAPRHETPVAALPSSALTPAPAPDGSGLAAAAMPDESAAPSNATIYELNPGAGREEPRVVWIVDRGLDI
jgi:anti-sigma factor RsiW